MELRGRSQAVGCLSILFTTDHHCSRGHATLYRRRRCVTNGELTLTLLSTSQAKSEVPLPELLHRPMPPPFQLPLAAPVYMHAAGPHPPETASALEAILARLARRAKRKQRAGLGEQLVRR